MRLIRNIFAHNSATMKCSSHETPLLCLRMNTGIEDIGAHQGLIALKFVSQGTNSGMQLFQQQAHVVISRKEYFLRREVVVHEILYGYNEPRRLIDHFSIRLERGVYYAFD